MVNVLHINFKEGYIDIYELGIWRDLLMLRLVGEDGNITEEDELFLKDIEERVQIYKRNLNRLYKQAYQRVSYYIYLEELGRLTEESLIKKIKHERDKTKEVREALVNKYIKLKELGDIDTFSEFDYNKYLK